MRDRLFRQWSVLVHPTVGHLRILVNIGQVAVTVFLNFCSPRKLWMDSQKESDSPCGG